MATVSVSKFLRSMTSIQLIKWFMRVKQFMNSFEGRNGPIISMRTTENLSSSCEYFPIQIFLCWDVSVA